MNRRLVSQFNASGERTDCFARTRISVLTAGLALALASAPAMGGTSDEIGASSTRAINITVSVAPKYKLMMANSGGTDLPALESGRLCVKSNTVAAALPVTLVLADVGDEPKPADREPLKMTVPVCQSGTDPHPLPARVTARSGAPSIIIASE